MACMEYFFFCICLQRMEPEPPRPWLEKLEASIANSPEWRAGCVLFLALAGTSWTQLHWAPAGQPYLVLSGLPALFRDFFFLP